MSGIIKSMLYTQLETETEINTFTKKLRENGRTTIALDFEGEFNLHCYGEKLCLIQICDGEEFFIIDPLKADLSAVKNLLEDEKIMKIMWDAQSDISLIVNGYDMTIKSVLDLRPAADLLELERRDYASVAAELLGIEKKQGKSAFQKYNWMRRPVDRDAVEYALHDVTHLHQLRDVVFERLFKAEMLNEFLRLNMIIQNRNYVREPGQRHKKMKGYKYLNSLEKRRLKLIFDFRDGFARSLDWPPNRVIPNPDVIDIAKGLIVPEDIRFDRKLSGKMQEQIVSGIKKEVGN